jgi:hypothetical protein
MLFIEYISSVRKSGLSLLEEPVFGYFGERLAREKDVTSYS